MIRRQTVLFFLLASVAFAQRPVTFVVANGTSIHADLYGDGQRGVVLAHGGRFDKESWKKQAQILAASHFLVLATEFRGDKRNADGSAYASGPYADHAADVLGAVRYLHKVGAKSVSIVGASMGGDAAAEAAAQANPGEVDSIVLLATSGGDSVEKLKCPKLFIVARDDASAEGLRLPGIREEFEKAPEPKKLVILNGSAHAQFIFDTDQGPRLMQEILDFLQSPQKEAALLQHARGTFEVKVQPLPSAPAEGLMRMSINKEIHGDLEATSTGEMISAGNPKAGEAGYVAIELVTGTLGGRSGGFALQQFATMDASGPKLQIAVAPGSGTGELKGIAGTFTITIANGSHSYDFEYTLPAKSASM